MLSARCISLSRCSLNMKDQEVVTYFRKHNSFKHRPKSHNPTVFEYLEQLEHIDAKKVISEIRS